jgi:hypothetical protein
VIGRIPPNGFFLVFLVGTFLIAGPPPLLASLTVSVSLTFCMGNPTKKKFLDFAHFSRPLLRGEIS